MLRIMLAEMASGVPIISVKKFAAQLEHIASGIDSNTPIMLRIGETCSISTFDRLYIKKGRLVVGTTQITLDRYLRLSRIESSFLGVDIDSPEGRVMVFSTGIESQLGFIAVGHDVVDKAIYGQIAQALSEIAPAIAPGRNRYTIYDYQQPPRRNGITVTHSNGAITRGCAPVSTPFGFHLETDEGRIVHEMFWDQVTWMERSEIGLQIETNAELVHLGADG